MKTAISNGINGPAYAAYTGGGYRGGSGTYPGSNSGEYFDGEHAKAIFDEAIQMSDFEHINVMKLIGVSFNRMAEPEMILPLMDKGDLRNYVKDDKNEILIRDVSKIISLLSTLVSLKIVESSEAKNKLRVKFCRILNFDTKVRFALLVSLRCTQPF
jgi:hypothetical protein